MSMMTRVSRANHCPICDNDTWCLIGRSCVICMRVPSQKTKTFKGGEVGYIHPHPDPSKRPVYDPPKPKSAPQVNVRRVLKDWFRATQDSRITQLSKNLGVSESSLLQLECQLAPGYSSATWGFPMKDGYGNYIGIRLRNYAGNKWAVNGSQAGIFIPTIKTQPRMFVVEGPTDTAAGLTIGLYTVGRPSCSGGVTHIVDWVKRNPIKEVVIVSDNDDPGIRGAKDLQRWLKVPSCILLLPCKDMRDFIKFGDKSTIDSMTQQLVWTQPKEV